MKAVSNALLVAFFFAALVSFGESQARQPAAESQGSGQIQLMRAVMCEDVQDLKPVNEAVVFSVSVGRVSCFTAFENVKDNTNIYHRWFHRDELSTQIQLKLYPPKWRTYSSIQLRDNDKGPWHVEVTDGEGHIFQVLRFSITD